MCRSASSGGFHSRFSSGCSQRARLFIRMPSPAAVEADILKDDQPALEVDSGFGPKGPLALAASHARGFVVMGGVGFFGHHPSLRRRELATY